MELRKIVVLILIAGTNATRLPLVDGDRPNSPSFLDGIFRYINPGGGPGLQGGLPNEQRIRDLARSAVDYGVVALTRFLGPAIRNGGLPGLGGLGGLGGGGLGGLAGLGGLGGTGSGSARSAPDGDGKNLSLDDEFADFDDSSKESSRARRRAGLFGDLVKNDQPPSAPNQAEGPEKRLGVGNAQSLRSEAVANSSVKHSGTWFLVSLISLICVMIL